MCIRDSPDYNLADWVLSRFTDEEMKKLSDVDKNTCEAVELMVQGIQHNDLILV